MKTSNPPVTKDDVRNALEQLKESGQSVTMEKIRAAIGSGSLTTILKYYKQIQSDIAEQTRLSDPTEPPSEVKVVGDELSNRLIRHAFEAGLKRGLEQIQSLREAIVTVEQERDELLADLELKEAAFSTREIEITQIKEALQGSINAERQRVDALRAEIDKLRVESVANEKASAHTISRLSEELHASYLTISENRVQLEKAKSRLLLVKDKRFIPSVQTSKSEFPA